MVRNRPTNSRATSPALDGSTPAPSTPTVTHYQQLAAEFTAQLVETAALVPKLEPSHVSTVNFVRAHMNIPTEFLATTVAAVEQTPELAAVKKLDVVEGRDTLQFIEAFRPVIDRVAALLRDLQYTVNSRKALLAADALQTYNIAKGLARDPNSGAVEALVANMKRDLGRSGRTKAATAAARKAAAAATKEEGSAPASPANAS
jgi:hypothetical protein